MRGWLAAACLAAMAACGVDEQVAPPATPPLDGVWEASVRVGDVIVLVPGTGARDYLGEPIEALPTAAVDVRTHAKVASDAVVFEQAIATARRAGIADADLGKLTFLVWGAGFRHLTAFDYTSYDGLVLHVDVLGGQNACAVGLIADNYLNYSSTSADADARDLYTRLRGWLSAHPSAARRNVTLVSHSWGGAVAELLALELPAIEAALGPLDAALPFTVAAGVPGFVPGYTFIGPSVRDLRRASGEVAYLYEVDRPDDPVHNMTFEGDFGGHHYNILFGDQFLGSYGITTDELSCHGVPGACAY